MALIGQGEATLTLADGTELTIRIDNEALIAAEDVADCNVDMLLKRLRVGRLGAARAVFVGSLQKYHPEITIEAATTLVTDQMAVVMAALRKALEAAFPAASAKAKTVEATAGAGGNAPRARGGKSKLKDGSKPV